MEDTTTPDHSTVAVYVIAVTSYFSDSSVPKYKEQDLGTDKEQAQRLYDYCNRCAQSLVSNPKNTLARVTVELREATILMHDEHLAN